MYEYLVRVGRQCGKKICKFGHRVARESYKLVHAFAHHKISEHTRVTPDRNTEKHRPHFVGIENDPILDEEIYVYAIGVGKNYVHDQRIEKRQIKNPRGRLNRRKLVT